MKQRKRTSGKRPQRGMWARLIRFLREVRAEMKRVSWPSRTQTIRSTVITLITVTILVLFIFGLDSLFGWAVLNWAQ